MNRAIHQNGFILMPVIIAIVLIATIAFMLNNQSTFAVDEIGDRQQAEQVENIARAGLAHATWAAQNSSCAGDTTVTTVAFGDGNYSGTIDAAATSTSSYTLNPDYDTHIRQNNPDINYGSESGILLGPLRRGLLHFDLSSISAGTQITSATLWLYFTTNDPADAINIHPVSEAWTEAGATWNTTASSYDSAVFGVIPPLPAANAWVAINLTALAQSWVNNAAANHGLMLLVESLTTDSRFNSREHSDVTQRPYLQITTADAAVSPVMISATGTLTGNPTPANDITRSLTRSNVRTYQAPGKVGFQLGTDPGEDTLLDSFYDARNYGGASYLQVHDNGTDWQQYPLIRFDLAGLPRGAAVRSAQLELRLLSLNAPGTATIHQVTRSWVEGTKAGGGTADGATWFTHDGTNAWTSAGGDINASVVAETTINGGETWVSWEIASLVERWLAGEPNNGLLIRPDSALKQANFASKENSTVGVQPKLTITYACECGSPCLAPQGSGNVVMVVGDDSVLTADDAAAKALFESWGYIVSLINDNTGAVSYQQAANNNDVAYVAASASATSVASKLTGLSIGVVSALGGLNTELGIASSSAWTVGAAINVTDTSHYITALFPTGPLDIYAAGMEQLTVSGTEAPGLQTLADSGGAGSLVVLDTGATLTGGGSAAGRRVILPLGREGKFNWDYLNSSGRLLVQRAIEWAKGAGSTPAPAYNVLLIVGNLTLSSKDVGYKALMESWGHTVSVLDDGASQADYNTAMAAADVIYASGSALGANMLDKATNTTKGLVNEVNGKIDNFGFSSITSSTINTDTFTKTNPAHYITELFAGNPVTVFTSSLTNPVPDGTLAPDLQIVGEVTGTLVLGTLDTGATRYDSNPSQGRRVHIPFASAEVTDLTADGETIMQRAIEWAAGTGVTSTAPIAHWKLDETSGTTAVDSVGGHDGTLNNGPVWSAGQIDGALDFDGSNDAIRVPHADTLSLTDTMTFIAWVNASSYGASYQTIVAKDSGAGDSNYYFGTWQQDLVFGFFSGPFFREIFTTGLNLQAGTWYQLAASFDNATDEVRLYVDGVEVHNGTLAFSPSAVTADLSIGRSPIGEYWRGLLDDVRIYDSVLPAAEIADLYSSGGGGGGPGYTELYQPWSASTPDNWETVDLGAFGVPANAVVEVAVINTGISAERWGGVRAVGSSLERRFLLHEAEAGGADAVTMHVQTDAGSQIQHYSDNTGQVSFILLGYWTGASYVERLDAFKAGANASWQGHVLGSYGVGPDQVAEIAISQTSTSIEWLVGARRSGSSLQRRISLHEAEGGGVDMVSLMVESDASSMIEVYAGADSVVDFHLLGYWSTPPGTYTETGDVSGQATVTSSWQTTNLSGFGIPANSIAQFVMSNEGDGKENQMGLRETGSTTPDRRLDLQEAEDGGGNLGTMHVKVDASSEIQWAAEYGATDGFFYPVGWWVLP